MNRPHDFALRAPGFAQPRHGADAPVPTVAAARQHVRHLGRAGEYDDASALGHLGIAEVTGQMAINAQIGTSLWQSVGQAPVVTGGENVITNSLTPGNLFFRLRN